MIVGSFASLSRLGDDDMTKQRRCEMSFRGSAIEIQRQQINERTSLVREIEWFTHDHLRQGEPA